MPTPAPTPDRVCPFCGYDMQGGAGDRCPECGHVHPADERTYDSHWSVCLLFAALSLAGGLGVMVAMVVLESHAKGWWLFYLSPLAGIVLGSLSLRETLATDRLTRLKRPVPLQLIVMLLAAFGLIQISLVVVLIGAAF